MRAIRLTLLLVTLGLLGACSDTGYYLSINYPGRLDITILNAADDMPIGDATVTVVNADTKANVAWLLSDADGRVATNLPQGSYYVRINAQGYLPSPPAGQEAVAFQVLANLITSKTYRLTADANAVNSGQLRGTITTTAGNGLGGVLVVAKDSAQGITLSAVSAGDGSYRLYNVPPGDYAVEGLIAGYRQVTAPGSVNVPPSTTVSGIDRVLEMAANANLSGKLSFLSIVNGIVDITLLQPDTLDPIPGLNTYNNPSGNTYTLQGVPPGDYLAWASYRNDGYVMDPDSIRKFGLPTVSFTLGGGDQVQDFNVTGAITLTSPTNPPGLLIPQTVSSATPLFQWQAYPSAKEYVIEVRDSQGQVIWGGYDSSGNILHSPIPANSNPSYSVNFNFDGSATAPLVAGETYRWKVYADNDATPNIQGLISASEQQMGLFRYQP